MPSRGVVMRTALVIVLVLVVVLGALWLLQRRLIYLPDTSAPPPAASVLAGAREVTYTTSDALALSAWLVPPRGPDRRVAVLLAPGNGGNRAGRAGLAGALAAAGLTVLVMDYRGYGGNPGSPTEAGLVADARAAREFLVRGGGWPARRVIYLGESLGAAVVARLALEHPPGALVLRSPFVDLAAAGQHNYPMLPVRPLLRDRFPVADLVARIHVPLLVVYGTSDSIIPPAQSEQVAAQAAGPVTTVAIDGADHNDPILVQGRAFVEAMIALAERLA